MTKGVGPIDVREQALFAQEGEVMQPKERVTPGSRGDAAGGVVVGAMAQHHPPGLACSGHCSVVLI